MNQTTKTTLAASLTLTLIGIATAQISRPTAPGVRSPDASARVSAEHVSVETAPLINGEPPRPDVRPKRPELPSKSGPDQKPESKVFAKVESQVPANGSLVMGGEVNELGMRQFYILTPQRSKGSDGKDLVLLNCDVISMSQAEATQAGLNSLFTEKETTQQNAEIWTKEDYSSTLKALAERGGKALIKSPAVVTRAEEEVRVEMSDAGVKLKLCTKVSFAGQDGFIVKSELRK